MEAGFSDDEWVVIKKPLKLLSTLIETNIENRYAKTLIVSKVENDKENAQEVTFSIVTPDQAYISEFILEIDGKQYEAKVKEKQEAKDIFQTEVLRGRGAAHVAASARDSNRFTVSVNVEPRSKAAFYLKYEELINRRNNKYEVVLNINPGQFVEDFKVVVNIEETRPIKFVKVPYLRSGNEAIEDNPNLDPEANVQMTSENGATAKFTPSIEKQKSLMQHLPGDKCGLAGQFIVQFDVIRDPQGGEVLIDESGYFVHFFAPELPPLNKQVIFVLDVSGSMHGRKIEQLKQAMHKIMDELNPENSFSIIDFNTTVSAWDISLVEVTYQKSCEEFYSMPLKEPIQFEGKESTPPSSFRATPEMIANAHRVIGKLEAEGGTDILAAVQLGLEIINKTEANDGIQPIIIFLTDGQPTVGQTNTATILSEITTANIRKVPIFCLSLGDGADRAFLQKLSLKNYAFSKHIYEAADASLQLEEFFKGISSPLLANVNFKYVNNVEKVTTTRFPVLFQGCELYISGIAIQGFHVPDVLASGRSGNIKFKANLLNVSNSLERLWAYLTIKKLLEDYKMSEDQTLKKNALELALKYSFVTDVSSLVVVKPDSSSAVDTEDASRQAHNPLEPRGRKKIIKKTRVRKSGKPQCVQADSTSADFGVESMSAGLKSANFNSFGSGSIPQVRHFMSARSNTGLVSQACFFGSGPANTGFAGAQSGGAGHLNLKNMEVLDPLASNLDVVIKEVHIESAISNCYEMTTVVFITKNNHKTNPALSNLPLIVPNGAFITSGVLEVAGKQYLGCIQPKDIALSVFHKSKIDLKQAGLIQLQDAKQNKYTVSISIPPDSEAFVQLTYERLIPKVNNRYQVKFIILPEIVGDIITAKVIINSLRPLISPETLDQSEATQSRMKDTMTTFFFEEEILKRKVMSAGPNGAEFGVSFGFMNDPFNGQVLVDDGYFTFPFEADVPLVNKVVMFVLDTACSTSANKIILKNMLNRLHPNDQFAIIQCSRKASVWDVESSKISYEVADLSAFNNQVVPQPFKATKENIAKAEQIVDNICNTCDSEVILALGVAIKFINETRKHDMDDIRPVIILIKIIEPTAEPMGDELNKVTEMNKYQIPLFAIVEGDYMPSSIYQKVCNENRGFVRRLYTFLDRDTQIAEFCKSIQTAIGLHLTFREESKTFNFRGQTPPFIPPPTKITHRELYMACDFISKEMRERISTSSTVSTSRLETLYSVVTDITSLIMVKP